MIRGFCPIRYARGKFLPLLTGIFPELVGLPDKTLQPEKGNDKTDS
ncbi:hypothetical protein [Erwinia sp. E_sp_B04_7]